MSELTTLGPLLFTQSKRGYRHNVDSVILSNFVEIKGNERILDVGSGDGVISVILKYKFPDITITGIEIQENLYRLSVLNAHQNNLDIKFLNSDFFKIDFKEAKFNIIITNPPYYPISSGRLSLSHEKTVAKHEITFNLKDFLFYSKRILAQNGSIYFIYPTSRFLFAFNEIYKNNFYIKRLRHVYNTIEEESVLTLFQISKHQHKSFIIDKPLIIYKDKFKKEYTDELNTYLFYS